METNLKESKVEKSLVKKGETALKSKNTYTVKPLLQTTVGIFFYIASFAVAAVLGYKLIFYVFN